MDLMDYRRKIIANSPHLMSASGAVATFSDGADLPLESLVVDIEPVQSGTGDPSPSNVRPITGWNGVNLTKCGKNLSPINANNVSPRTYWGTNWTELIAVLNTLPVGVYTISNKFTVVTLPNNGQVAHGRIYITAMVNGTQRGVTSYSVTNDTSPTVGKVYQESGTFTITEEIRGNINHAYLYCDSTDHSASSADKGTYTLTDIQIELGSTATPYEPYNGMFVQIGLNLLALPFVYYTGVSTDLSNYFFVKAGTYTFSFGTGTASSWRFIVRLKDLDGNEISDSQHNPSNTLAYRDTLNGYTNGGNTTAKELVLNIAEDCYIRILHWMTASPQTDTFNDCKLEEGSTATEYQPYTGTVYGGTLNPLTGVLTVDRYWWELNTDASKWTKSSSYPGGFYTGGANYVWNWQQVKPSTPFLCSHAKTATTLSEYGANRNVCYMDNSINIRIMSDTATKQDWIDYLAAQKSAGTPVQICCYLRNPVTIQLTPQQIRSLYGNNTIFADTGNVALEYWAHP